MKHVRRRSPGAAKRLPLAPDDLLKFRLAADPQISPDGGRIVFVEKHVGGKNDYVTNLWTVATRGGRPRPFTEGGKDHSPRWSPDGARIAFIRAADKHRPQVFAIDASGGEARRLTDFPEGSIGQFCWSPNGKWLAVSFRQQDPQRTQHAEKERKEKGLSDPPQVVDGLFYRLDGDGYFGDQRYRLYLVDAKSGTARELYGEDTLGSLSFDFSPDSRQLVVSTNRDETPTLHPWKDELLRIRVAGGKVTPIRGLPAGPKTSVRCSPDGQTIAYAGRIGKDPVYSPENLELFVCHPVRGGARSLTGQYDHCLQAAGIADLSDASFEPSLQFSRDGSRIYVRLGISGESHIASVPAGGGRLAIHTRGPLDVQMGNLSADGANMALLIGTTTKPAEVAVGRCSSARFQTRFLSNLNGPLLARRQLAKPRSHWIRAVDGHKVQVWVVKPPGLKRGAKSRVPAVLEIHGGPHAQYGCGFFHEFQVLAAAGYAVFYSNPRGSKGYGRDHCAAIRGNWGGADWTDIQAVVRFMKSRPFVDPRRLGAIGGSYGGYMTNWAVSHCRQFAAAVTDRCLSNLVSFSGSTDVVEPPSDYFPGNFWDQPEARWNQSPLKYLADVKTPMLILHSEGDLRCNIEQAEQLHAALKLLGVPTRLVRYPASTGHGMSRSGPPDLRLHRLAQILAWWQAHLR